MKRHSFDAISFVFGLLFVILGARFMVGPVTFPGLRLSWLWPLTAVALGLALLLTARRSDTPQGSESADGESAGRSNETDA